MTDFRLNAKQRQLYELIRSDATHVMAYGGARSGKTFALFRAVMVRALKAKSRHAVLRYRFNHIKASVVYDTMPKVMDLCWPGLRAQSKLDKTDWFLTLPNGSEIWFGGLDDKERTEKILGQEYATIYMNECSQIPWASRNMAITRLAQKVDGLRNKAFYDANPPSMSHWTYRLFIERRDPDSRQYIANPENYASILINPNDNRDNIAADFMAELEALPERQRRRFLLGQFQDASESALWTLELLDQQRILDGSLPQMQRIIISVDPSGCSGDEDTRSDEVGIVVVGLGVDGKAYVLEDLSGKFGPDKWGTVVVTAFDRHNADAVVAETNYGGAMVGAIVKAAANDPDRKSRVPVPFREVTASRGKVVRAEPVSVLFEQEKVYLAGRFEALEDQLCAFTTGGYTGNKSPDRADAMVWAITDLFPAVARKQPDALTFRRPQVVLGHANKKRRRA